MSDMREEAIKLAQRHYIVIIFRDKLDEDEYVYMAINPELEGCMAQGETPEEAQDILDAVRVDYMEHLLEHNLPIPEPEFLSSQTASVSVVEENFKTVRDLDGILGEIIQPDDRDTLVEAQFIPLPE